jgi:hypothetical protein
LQGKRTHPHPVRQVQERYESSLVLHEQRLRSARNYSQRPVLADRNEQATSDEQENDSAYWKQKAKESLARAAKLQTQLEQAEAHASFAGSYINQIQAKANKKKGRSKRNVRILARVATSDEFNEEYERQRASREAKKAATARRLGAKADEAALNRVLRMDRGQDGMTWNKSISACKLIDLQNIAWSRGLLEDGKKEELLDRIRAYFDNPDNAHHRKSQQYAPLFLTKSELRQCAWNTDVSAMASSSANTASPRTVPTSDDGLEIDFSSPDSLDLLTLIPFPANDELQPLL